MSWGLSRSLITKIEVILTSEHFLTPKQHPENFPKNRHFQPKMVIVAVYSVRRAPAKRARLKGGAKPQQKTEPSTKYGKINPKIIRARNFYIFNNLIFVKNRSKTGFLGLFFHILCSVVFCCGLVA